jgi:STE24 endopeptidase
MTRPAVILIVLASSLAASSARAAADSTDYVVQVLETFTPETRAYAAARATLGFLEPVYALLAMAFLLFSGASARMRDAAHGIAHRPWLRAALYVALFAVAVTLLGLPFEWYRGYALEHRYGMSNQTFGEWLADQGKGVLVGIAVFGVVPLARATLAALERFPRFGWAVVAAGTLPVLLAGALLQPLVVDPLFNRFEPLRDPALERRIVALAERAGVSGGRVLQADRSEQTRKLNAYVNGFGATHRIVLWDTLIDGMRPDEVLFVTGHELGHYVLQHVWKGLALSGLLAFAAWGFAVALSRAALARWGRRWEVPAVHDLAAVPLLIASLTLLSLPAQPAIHAFSRAVEHEADVFALELTHDNDAGARSFLKLAAGNRSNPDPDPIVKWFLYTHPPLLDRIRFALDYRPWERGEPPRVFHGPPPGGSP